MDNNPNVVVLSDADFAALKDTFAQQHLQMQGIRDKAAADMQAIQQAVQAAMLPLQAATTATFKQLKDETARRAALPKPA